MAANAKRDKLLEAIEAIEAQNSKNGILNVVLAFGTLFGFEYVTIGQLIHPSLKDMDYGELGVSNYPIAFQKQYISENYLLHDPVIKCAATTQDAFVWRELITSASKREKKIFDHCRAHGMSDGVTVPIHLEDRTPGLVSFAGTAQIVEQDDIESLALLGFHAYSRLLDIYDASKQKKKIQLTPREIDVLHHVACGRTDLEIARILKLGHYSVKDHLANARRKLGATNRAHCVMIAIRDKHIIL